MNQVEMELHATVYVQGCVIRGLAKKLAQPEKNLHNLVVDEVAPVAAELRRTNPELSQLFAAACRKALDSLPANF